MYLMINGNHCWVIEPSEAELAALCWKEAYKQRLRSTPFGVITAISMLIGILSVASIPVFWHSVFSPVLAVLVGSSFMILPILYIGGIFHREHLKVLDKLEKSDRVIDLRHDEVGESLRHHVLFAEPHKLEWEQQLLVFQQLSDVNPSVLDDFLKNAHTRKAIKRIMYVDNPSVAYDLYQITLWRRAEAVFDAILPFAQPLIDEERVKRAEAIEAKNAALHERAVRQTVEARDFSLLDD